MTTLEAAVTGRVRMYPRFAARIAELGVKHADLADAVGCAHSTIGAVYRGTIIPSESLKARFAEVLNMPVAELFAFHPAVERLLAQAEAQGIVRGSTDPAVLRRIALLANTRNPEGSHAENV